MRDEGGSQEALTPRDAAAPDKARTAMTSDEAPRIYVLAGVHGKIVGPADLSQTPDWAKPIVAAALNLHPGRKIRRR
jgi:hypothetical protein